jgi:gluconolactonase
MIKTKTLLIVVPILALLLSCGTKSVVAPGAEIQKIARDLKFTEGPVDDNNGNLYFSDIPANIIYKYSEDGKLSVFRENSGGSNGLKFDRQGNLLACEGGRRRLVSIDQAGNITVLADSFRLKPFNSPNDLWIDPKGGIYRIHITDKTLKVLCRMVSMFTIFLLNGILFSG